MRIIHTADWHLGQFIHGWPRDAEHKLYFERLADLIEAEEADALLVAGDVFDVSNPSGDSQEILYAALSEFKRRRPDLTIVLSGGNHDPGQRLEAPSPLMKAQDMHVVGTVKRSRAGVDVARMVFPLTKNGEVKAYVLAVPFLRAADLPGAHSTEEEGSPIIRAARAFFAEVTEAALEIAGDLPLIATAHLQCAGGTESEGAERRVLIGGSHALPVDVFPSALRYVALGHLHMPQNHDGGRVRYSGSCFPLSASEMSYNHGVTVIDLDGEDMTIRHVPIEPPAPMYRIPKTGQIALEDLDEALDAIDVDLEVPVGLRPIIYLEMVGNDAASIIKAEALTKVNVRGLRSAGLRIHRMGSAKKDSDEVLVSLQDTDPEDLFVAAFTDMNDFEPEDRHLIAFREALSEV